MPRQVPITGKQLMEVHVNGPEGANRLFICTGSLQVFLSATDDSANGTGVTARETFKALIEPDPQLTPGQFRRAIAQAAITSFSSADNDPAQKDRVSWAIEEAEADLDDESSQVELRVALMVNPAGAGSNVTLREVSFQVHILAQV